MGGEDTNAGGLGMWRLALGSPCSRSRTCVEVELTFLISLCMSALEDERERFPAYMHVCERAEKRHRAVLLFTPKSLPLFSKSDLGRIIEY